MVLSAVKSNGIVLSERAAEQIVKYIQENRLESGSRLPNENELSERLNVSRSTLREAMRSLRSRGIVEIRQGSGTYVSSMPGVAQDPLGLEFKYDKKKNLFDLLEIRIMIEPPTAAYCAERASTKERQEIKELAQGITERIRRGASYVDQDIAFHCKISASCGNDILQVLTPEIVKGVEMFIGFADEQIVSKQPKIHEDIAQAIFDRDAKRAYDAMYEHFVENEIVFKEYYTDKK